MRGNKYGQSKWDYGVETFTRISLDCCGFYTIYNYLDQFDSFNEREMENVLTRKAKLNKINSLKI